MLVISIKWQNFESSGHWNRRFCCRKAKRVRNNLTTKLELVRQNSLQTEKKLNPPMRNYHIASIPAIPGATFLRCVMPFLRLRPSYYSSYQTYSRVEDPTTLTTGHEPESTVSDRGVCSGALGPALTGTCTSVCAGTQCERPPAVGGGAPVPSPGPGGRRGGGWEGRGPRSEREILDLQRLLMQQAPRPARRTCRQCPQRAVVHANRLVPGQYQVQSHGTPLLPPRG